MKAQYEDQDLETVRQEDAKMRKNSYQTQGTKKSVSKEQAKLPSEIMKESDSDSKFKIASSQEISSPEPDSRASRNKNDKNSAKRGGE